MRSDICNLRAIVRGWTAEACGFAASARQLVRRAGRSRDAFDPRVASSPFGVDVVAFSGDAGASRLRITEPCPLRLVRDCARPGRRLGHGVVEDPERASRRSRRTLRCTTAARAARSERRKPRKSGARALLGSTRASPVTCAYGRTLARSREGPIRSGSERGGDSLSNAVAGQDSVVTAPPRRDATRLEVGMPGSASVRTTGRVEIALRAASSGALSTQRPALPRVLCRKGVPAPPRTVARAAPL